MKIFDKDGWLDMPKIIETGYPFIFVWGGRNTGKTFGTFKYFHERNLPFGYLRSWGTQIQLAQKESLNPFRAINEELGANYHIKGGEIYNTTPDGERVLRGFAQGLKTAGNVRGIEARHIDYIMYDEFIPTPGEKWLPDVSTLIKSFYGTISRDRETKGKKPLQFIGLANSNNIVNPVFVGLGIISNVEKMVNNNMPVMYLKERGLLLVNAEGSPRSKMQENNAVYKLGGNDGYNDMALNNKFADMDYTGVRSMPLKEYNPLVTIGELTIYTHKSNGTYYVSFHRSGSCPCYACDKIGKMQYRARFGSTWGALAAQRMYFETLYAKELYIQIHTRA